ncbi:MAG: GTPase Era [Syntrophomonadaceae bacterium]|nr:GTPase Era [Syntrophomonadaceae bacterium]
MKSGFVSIIGRPNVGKSTLINKLIGAKIAIVSDKPQTTRTRIQGILTKDEGQIIFVDTPGIHKPKHLLGEYMLQISTQSLSEVDLIYYMTDASRPFGAGEQYIIEQLKTSPIPVFLVVNKIDLVSDQQLKEFVQPFYGQMNFAEHIPISAANGTNLADLLEKTLQYLPEGPLYYPADDLTDQPVSFIVAELIREKALILTRDEVPHSLAVVVEEFRYQGTGKIYVRAVIHTERDSQKAIIIGKNGQMLKKIGAESRIDIEKMLETSVYLDLWVKVKKNWRDNANNLSQLGYRP